MLNSSFIELTLINLNQEELWKNRLDREKTNNYNFDFVPFTGINFSRDRLKFVNRFDLHDKEYSKEELSGIYLALINGLVEGIIKEADKRNCKSGQYTYSIESLEVGGDKYDSSGYILYVPHQIVYPGNT